MSISKEAQQLIERLQNSSISDGQLVNHLIVFALRSENDYKAIIETVKAPKVLKFHEIYGDVLLSYGRFLRGQERDKAALRAAREQLNRTPGEETILAAMARMLSPKALAILIENEGVFVPEAVRLFPDRLINAVDRGAVSARALLDRAGDQGERLLHEMAHPLRGVSDECYVRLAQEGELTLNEIVEAHPLRFVQMVEKKQIWAGAEIFRAEHPRKECAEGLAELIERLDDSVKRSFVFDGVRLDAPSVECFLTICDLTGETEPLLNLILEAIRSLGEPKTIQYADRIVKCALLPKDHRVFFAAKLLETLDIDTLTKLLEERRFDINMLALAKSGPVWAKILAQAVLRNPEIYTDDVIIDMLQHPKINRHLQEHFLSELSTRGCKYCQGSRFGLVSENGRVHVYLECRRPEAGRVTDIARIVRVCCSPVKTRSCRYYDKLDPNLSGATGQPAPVIPAKRR